MMGSGVRISLAAPIFCDSSGTYDLVNDARRSGFPPRYQIDTPVPRETICRVVNAGNLRLSCVRIPSYLSHLHGISPRISPLDIPGKREKVRLAQANVRRLKTSMNTSNQNILRPPEAGKYLGLSASTLAKQRLRGDGPKFVRLSPRAIGYLQGDLDEWLTSRRCLSTSEYGRLNADSPTG
jgi:predicted DNA-binding transcriptional regulator AlpA